MHEKNLIITSVVLFYLKFSLNNKNCRIELEISQYTVRRLSMFKLIKKEFIFFLRERKTKLKNYFSSSVIIDMVEGKYRDVLI